MLRGWCQTTSCIGPDVIANRKCFIMVRTKQYACVARIILIPAVWDGAGKLHQKFAVRVAAFWRCLHRPAKLPMVC